MSYLIETGIIRHFIIFFQMAGLCCGVVMIYHMYSARAKGVEYFKNELIGLMRFYVPFFGLYFINYVLFYSDNYIHLVHTNYTQIYILLSFLFDVLMILSMFFWIRFSNDGIDHVINKMIIATSIIYMVAWTINYIFIVSDLDLISTEIDSLILAIADILYVFVMATAILCTIRRYIVQLKFDVNRRAFIICNTALLVYLAFVMIVDVYVQYCSIQNISTYYGDLYLYFDPLIFVFIIVSIETSRYISSKVKDAEIKEHDKLVSQVNMHIHENDISRYEKYNLTSREKEILELILRGYSNPQIAEELFISVSTVKRHVNNILRKTDTRNRYELIAVSYS